MAPNVAVSASGESFDYFMDFFGKCFVRFFTNFGYDKMLKATGRYFCDFLQSVDNIHLQMRFTYPKMKSPSMQLTHVDEDGAVLVYRSGRSGFSKCVTFNEIDELLKHLAAILAVPNGRKAAAWHAFFSLAREVLLIFP